MKQIHQEQGFGLAGILLVAAVLAVIGAAGWAVYRHSHKSYGGPMAGSGGNTSQATKSDGAHTAVTTPPSDPYAGWKTYCDGIYRYCFKYPADWSLDARNATKAGEVSRVSVTNPGKTVSVGYTNPDLHDVGIVDFNTVDLATLMPASQSLSIVGGYVASSGISGNYPPMYEVVSSSTLKTYPLTKGQASQFPNNPMFPDANGSQGSFRESSLVSTDTTADAIAWFAKTETKTGLLILKSIYEQ